MNPNIHETNEANVREIERLNRLININVREIERLNRLIKIQESTIETLEHVEKLLRKENKELMEHIIKITK